MSRIVLSAMLTRLTKGFAATEMKERILKPFAEDLFNQFDSLKFLGLCGAG